MERSPHALSRRAVGLVALAAGLSGTGAAAQTSPGSAARPGETLLLIEKNAARLAFLDPASGQRMGEVELPDYPHEFVVDRAARHAFVGHYGIESSASTGAGGHAVLVVDLAARRVVRRIDLAPYNRLHGIALDAQDRLSVLSEDRAVLLTIDKPAEAASANAAVPAGGLKTHLFSLTRDGERAYVTGLLSNTASLVRPRDAAAAPVVTSVGGMPEGNCLSPDERTFYVASRRTGTLAALDAQTMRVRETREVGGDPLRVYALPDGRLLLTDLGRETIALLRPDMSEIWKMEVGGKPAAASLHPDRAAAFVSLASDQVLLVDLESRRIEARFPTGKGADVTKLVRIG